MPVLSAQPSAAPLLLLRRGYAVFTRVTERNGAHAHVERFNTVPVQNCTITPHGTFKMYCCRRRVRSDMPELCGACEGCQRFNWQLRSQQAHALVVDIAGEGRRCGGGGRHDDGSGGDGGRRGALLKLRGMCCRCAARRLDG
jgi:hypothetical protein